MSLRLGMTFRPQLPPERLRSVAQSADAAGLDELWLWEDCFRESGIATAAAALAWTRRIQVGIGLVPAPLRNVALTAMEAATLARLFPDRFILGIGHGVQEWMGQVGARVESPLTLLREYGSALTALLAGQEVTVAGRYVRLDRVRLDWPPDPPPPVMAGATGPKSLALCAQIARGTIVTSGRSAEEVRGIRTLLDDTRRDAGLSGPHGITASVIVTTGAGARERLHRELAAWGLPADDRLGIAGDAATIAAVMMEFASAGVDTLVVLATEDEPDVEGLVEFIGREVRPLL
jgi:alkanesulfonate monooxygenase SsuD/methylene tetrahydromethanopterin reductase-like flavin-dependent oxidoreductase (luciferase family)